MNFGPFAAKVDPRTLNVLLPTNDGKYVCLRISSRDGRYSARLQYPLTSNSGGRYGLALPTGRASDLGRYASRELAVLAEIKVTCSDTAALFIVPGGWDRTAGHDTLLVLTNSGGSDQTKIALTARGGAPSNGRCESIATANRVTYDTECILVVGSAALDLDIVVLQYDFQDLRPPYRLNVRAP